MAVVLMLLHFNAFHGHNVRSRFLRAAQIDPSPETPPKSRVKWLFEHQVLRVSPAGHLPSAPAGGEKDELSEPRSLCLPAWMARCGASWRTAAGDGERGADRVPRGAATASTSTTRTAPCVPTEMPASSSRATGLKPPGVFG